MNLLFPINKKSIINKIPHHKVPYQSNHHSILLFTLQLIHALRVFVKYAFYEMIVNDSFFFMLVYS